MKIIGFIDIDRRIEMVLKGDSAMLVNRKPFFIPDGTNDIGYTDCIVLRVSRLGKNIAPKFTDRYWDAWTYGLDFCAKDRLQDAITRQGSWTEAIAFDNSLAIGQFINSPLGTSFSEAVQSIIAPAPILPIAEAIHRASRVMTIRQGDYIYIQLKQPFVPIYKEQIITRTIDNNEVLYCKIK